MMQKHPPSRRKPAYVGGGVKLAAPAMIGGKQNLSASIPAFFTGMGAEFFSFELRIFVPQFFFILKRKYINIFLVMLFNAGLQI